MNGMPYYCDVDLLKLPYQLSQGNLNGRNGSSAYVPLFYYWFSLLFFFSTVY